MNPSLLVLDANGAPLRLAVSACLVGAKVRFDGGHRRDDFVCDVLARCFELHAFCPEVAAGLGTPRPTLRLERSERPGALRLVERGGRDRTDALGATVAHEVERLRALDPSGAIVKKDSPTCGLERVRVYGASGIPARDGTGLFTLALREAMPLLPVEEEGRLRDAALRASFLTRVVAHRRLRDLFRAGWRLVELERFHAASKMLLVAAVPEAARELGRLVARARTLPPDEVALRYTEGTLAALAQPPSRGRHVNALEHLAGHLRGRAPVEERRELREVIDDYARGRLPLPAVRVLLRHHARRHGLAWVAAQSYLEPYPRALDEAA